MDTLTESAAGHPLDKTHACYEHLESIRELPRDLMGGLPALKAKATLYFPRETMEQPTPAPGGMVDPWLLRMNRLRLFNKFKDGIVDLVGKVFSKRVQWSDDTPEAIAGDEKSDAKGFADDVDGRGTNAHVFLRRRCQNSAACGLDGVLVEFSKVGAVGERSVAEDRAAGFRPFWRAYSSSNILDWRVASIKGRVQIVYLKLRDWQDGTETAERIELRREFWVGDRATGTPVKFKVSAKKKTETGAEQWMDVDTGFRSPHFDIPFVPFATDAEEPFEAEPPLVDAAYVNLAHSRKTSDLDTSQHAVGSVIMTWSGVSLDDATAQMEKGISSTRFFVCTDAAGGIKFAGPDGASWEALEKTLDRMEHQMDAMLSAPMNRESSQPLSAEGEVRFGAKQQSQLESWVQQWTDATNLLLYFTAVDLGLVKPEATGGWGSVVLNRKFVASARDVERSRHAWELESQGKLSARTASRISTECGVFPEDFDHDEEQELIADEGPTADVPDDGDDLTKPAVEADPNNPQPKPGETKPEEKAA